MAAPFRAAGEVEVRDGPWGRLEISRIMIAPPAEPLPQNADAMFTTQWFFAGMDTSALTQFLNRMTLSDALREGLSSETTWRVEKDGITMTPTDESARDLDPAARAMLHDQLATSPRNDRSVHPWSIRSRELANILDMSGLNAASRKRFLRLAYTIGDRSFMSDSPVLMNMTGDRSQQAFLLRLLKSSIGYAVRLRIGSGEDVAKLIDYWGGRDRADLLRPLFDALSLLPAGDTLDISYLLPAFARERLNTFPDPSLAGDGIRRDCHWSSLNFYSNVPNDAFATRPGMVDELREHYVRVDKADQFGDLVFFERSSGVLIHSAVYLAANLVFTKNGDQSNQPWVIMDMDNLREFYDIAMNEHLTVMVMRQRISPAASAESMGWPP